jgi:CheY-like chemotaxis protein
MSPVRGAAALQLIVETSPDVAVIDISLPDLNGLELARRLAEACPGVRLLALTVHEDRAYVQPLLQAGARGYLLKRSAAEDLVRATARSRPAVSISTRRSPRRRCRSRSGAGRRRRTQSRSANASRKCSDSWHKGSATRRSPRGSTSAGRQSRPTRREGRTNWGCRRAPTSCATPPRGAGSTNSGRGHQAGSPRRWQARGLAEASEPGKRPCVLYHSSREPHHAV